MKKYIKVFFIISVFGLMSCGTFHGPGALQGPDYHPSVPVEAPVAQTKKAKIENDLEHPPSETMDDQGEQGVLDHLAQPSDHKSTEAPIAMHFGWPVDEAKLSRGFIDRKRKHHWGLDLANKKGTSILAAENGYIVYTGRQFHGYGRLIVIEHNEQWATLYAHLDKFSVKEGDFVKRGDIIGEMGRTGHATGSHLHFELRDNRAPVDPIPYLPAHE